jgi:immune inhibitor A
MANLRVVKNIIKQIKSSRALSAGDLWLAIAMRMVSADSLVLSGFNDGVFYPPTEGPSVLATLQSVRRPARSMTPKRLASRAPAAKLHALALLVDFSDNPGQLPASHFQRLLFNAGNADSLTSIYKELSRGKLMVTGQAVGYVRAPHPYTYYTNGQSGMGTSPPTNTPGLLQDALTEFCKTSSLAPFDTDGDGYVDGIFLIHAGGGAEAEPDPTRRPDMIWSHKWTLPTPFLNNGVRAYAYSTEPEDGKVGVFAHEFGHVLGLPDLYDTSYQSAGVGEWCLMGGGSWGGGGDKPTRLSCWCLARLGWITPKVVKKASTLSLPTLESDDKACHRLWTGGKSGTKYFLIENRQQTGRDAELPGHGLAVWLIDDTQSGNTNPLAYQVRLIQADGLRGLETNADTGDAGDLFPGSAKVTSLTDKTKPSTREFDGTSTGVALTNIREDVKTGVIRLKVDV